MDTPTTPTTSPVRAGAVTGLAIIGFIALVVLGLWLAVYAARYVPEAVDGLGAAVGSVGSMFTSKPESGLAVVPTSTSTLPFDGGTPSAVPPPATTSPTTTYVAPKPSAPAPVYYHTVQTTYPTPGSTPIPVSRTYSGLADLTVSITDVGYIDSDGRFVVDSSVDDDQELAAQILVVNTGTNKTGSWKIKVTFPTSSNRAFTETDTMQSLEPDQPLPITVSLSRGDPRTGTNRITVEVDSDDDVNESNEHNNDDSVSVTVR